MSGYLTSERSTHKQRASTSSAGTKTMSLWTGSLGVVSMKNMPQIAHNCIEFFSEFRVWCTQFDEICHLGLWKYKRLHSIRPGVDFCPSIDLVNKTNYLQIPQLGIFRRIEILLQAKDAHSEIRQSLQAEWYWIIWADTPHIYYLQKIAIYRTRSSLNLWMVDLYWIVESKFDSLWTEFGIFRSWIIALAQELLKNKLAKEHIHWLDWDHFFLQAKIPARGGQICWDCSVGVQNSPKTGRNYYCISLM